MTGTWLFPPTAPVAVPIAGRAAQYPVRRVYCVGQNYAAHTREMGGNPERETPFFFSKDVNSLVVVPTGTTGAFPYPSQTENCHHEVELVVALGSGGQNIAVEQALDHVYGYAIGYDMTRRDLQSQLKAKGRPWEVGKAFDGAGLLGPIHPAADVGHLTQGAITLAVNGAPRQKGDLSDLIWSVPEIIAYLSGFFALQAGDLIYTGTPEGVGAIVKGDTMLAQIAGLGEVAVAVV